jgi:hypothetical protein
MRRRPWPGDDRRGGIMLLLAFAMNSIFLAFVAGYVPFVQTMVRIPWFSHERDQALALAEAGMDWALGDLGATDGTPGAAWTSVDVSACDTLDRRTDGTLSGLPITSCHRHVAPRRLTAGDGSGEPIGQYVVFLVNGGANLARVVAGGLVPDFAQTRTIRAVAVDIIRPASFNFAAYGGGDLMIWGETHIDSYDSSLGAYEASTNKSQDADVGTNGQNTSGTQDVRVEDPNTTLEGDIWITPGDTVYVNPLTTFTGSVETTPDILLPHVAVPAALDSLPITTGNEAGWSGFNNVDGAGHFKCSNTTCVCDKPVHIRSLKVDGTSTFRVEDGCQMLIDKQGTVNPYGGLLLDINGSGRILKIDSAATNQVFVRDGGISFDGKGASWDTLIPDAQRLPERFQFYATCSVPPCNNATLSGWAPTLPFYGVVYIEGGSLEVAQGSENGWSYDSEIYGAVVAGSRVVLKGIYRDQYLADGVTPGPDGVNETYSMTFHYDKQLADLMIDGTGRRGFKYIVRQGTWHVR